MAYPPTLPNNTRLGFHYYPDTVHFRESDLKTWLPELHALGASWLTLVAPTDRAIPESFLGRLIAEGIEPVLHFHLSLKSPLPLYDLRLLFNAYARWGVRYVCLFDRPNMRSAWSATAWAQSNLVERFLDLYIPLAESAFQSGLTPVFPPLEPGGDYWDTAFLRAALQGMQRRGHLHRIRQIVVGAYGWADNQRLHWGAGGPENWPGSRPYYTPKDEEDQIGLHIFDWYLAISKAVLNEPFHILLLGAGSRLGMSSRPDLQPVDEVFHAQRNREIVQWVLDQENQKAIQGVDYDKEDNDIPVVPPEVLCLNFWILTATPDSPYSSQAWYQAGQDPLPVVDAIRELNIDFRPGPNAKAIPRMDLRGARGIETKNYQFSFQEDLHERKLPYHRISHYLLIPSYEWGIADWHLDVIRPFIKKYKPAVGFSISEASQADRVTVIGGPQLFTEESLEELRASGCLVERISGDGTSVASRLSVL